MLGAEERRKLMSRFENEPLRPLAAVLKCIAALLVLVLIAAGPWMFVTAGGAPGADALRAAPQVNQAVTDSKRVLDERRRTYESTRQAYTTAPENSATGGRMTGFSTGY